MGRHDHGGRDQHPGPGVPGEQPQPGLAQFGRQQPAPTPGHRSGPEQYGDDARHRAQRADDRQSLLGVAARGRPDGGRQEKQDRHGDRDQDHLACGPFEDDGPHATPDITGALPVPYRAVHIADDPAGQRRVQEQGPVVVGHGTAQRQLDAEPAGHQTPAPGAEYGGEQPERGRGEKGAGVDPAQPFQEGSGAQPPDEQREQRRPGERAESAPDGAGDRAGPHRPPPVRRGSASRSLWCTTAANPPAEHVA